MPPRGPRSHQPPTFLAITRSAAGYLALVTLLNVVVDFTFLSEGDGDRVGVVIASLLGDAGALVVLGAALWCSTVQQRR